MLAGLCEEWLSLLCESPILVLITVLVAATLAHYLLFCGTGDITNENATFQPCPNPNCVRCRLYNKVNEQAKLRLRTLKLEGSLDNGGKVERVVDAVRLGPKWTNQELSKTKSERDNYHSPCPSQYPSVLLVRNLGAHPIVSYKFKSCIAYVERFHQQILKEYEEAVQQTFASENKNTIWWSQNDTPKGHWHALHLMNQGVWNDYVVAQCPNTAQVVHGPESPLREHVMDGGCVFGNVFFSVLEQGTIIEPHCGPANVRHRLHLTLYQPATTRQRSEHRATLQVAGEVHTWATGRAFVFDDSLVHSVTFPEQSALVSQDRQVRVVLIVDLWHCDLSPTERDIITQLYQP